MDYGDIIRLIIFGFIFLSFFSGLFGKKKGDEEMKKQEPRPSRPTEVSESGGQPTPRPVVVAEPAGAGSAEASRWLAELSSPVAGRRSTGSLCEPEP